MSAELLPMVEEWPPVAILTPDELVTVDRLPVRLREMIRAALSSKRHAYDGDWMPLLDLLAAYEALRGFAGRTYPDPVYSTAAAYGLFSRATVDQLVAALEDA